MSKYRVAFIGCGNRAKPHAAAVQTDSRCEVVALSDLNLEAAQAILVLSSARAEAPGKDAAPTTSQ